MGEYILAMIAMFSCLAFGVGYAGWLIWSLSKTMLAQDTEFPAWLEAFFPLKGRWLALLLTMPLILLAGAAFFILVAVGLFLLCTIALLLYHQNALLGLLTFGALGWLLLRVTGVTGRLQSPGQKVPQVGPGRAGE